jgi:hypothetical protein
MLKHVTSLLAVIAIAACADDANNPVTPYQTGPADLLVSLDVQGNPDTGLSKYSITVDHNVAASIAPNSSQHISVEPGTHTIELGEATAIFGTPLWCAVQSPVSFSIDVAQNAMIPAKFDLYCPPLEGSARLLLTFYGTGGTLVDNVPISLQRLNGEPVSINSNAAPATQLDITVPPGLYRLRFGPAGNCKASSGYALFGWPALVIHPKEIVNKSFTLTCST